MSRTPKLLAVASSGGHWVQLLRLRPAWDGCTVSYVTTNPGYREALFAEEAQRGKDLPRFHIVTPATRWQKLRLIRQLSQILWIILTERPDVIVSTGAAPGFWALRFGKIFGARTIWIDSIANAETLSMSGKMVGNYADLWLTQWSHLKGSEKPEAEKPDYHGAVI